MALHASFELTKTLIVLVHINYDKGLNKKPAKVSSRPVAQEVYYKGLNQKLLRFLVDP